MIMSEPITKVETMKFEENGEESSQNKSDSIATNENTADFGDAESKDNKMDVEGEKNKNDGSDKNRSKQKKNNQSAKRNQKHRNEMFKVQSQVMKEEKPKLTREEMKNLQAIRLIEKSEKVTQFYILYLNVRCA